MPKLIDYGLGLVLVVACGVFDGCVRRPWLLCDVAAPVVPRAEVHRIDFMAFPLDMPEASWMERLRPWNGKVVEVVGCAVSMRPTRSWQEGFVIWPEDHCPFASNSPDGMPKLGFPKFARIVSVRMAKDAPEVPEKGALPLVRVVGRLRLGEVRGGRVLESWGAIVDAHAQVVPRP